MSWLLAMPAPVPQRKVADQQQRATEHYRPKRSNQRCGSASQAAGNSCQYQHAAQK
jgi:hypothetical protein